jgi:hypothetical protein
MDVHPKFIIETDEKLGKILILANCTFHKELASDISCIKGGGWWSLDREKNIFTLYGHSHDFGSATMEDIAECVQQKKVFSSSSMHRNYTDNYTFLYKDPGSFLHDLQTYKPTSNG